MLPPGSRGPTGCGSIGWTNSRGCITTDKRSETMPIAGDSCRSNILPRRIPSTKTTLYSWTMVVLYSSERTVRPEILYMRCLINSCRNRRLSISLYHLFFYGSWHCLGTVGNIHFDDIHPESDVLSITFDQVKKTMRCPVNKMRRLP